MAHAAQQLFFEKVKEAYPEFFAWRNVIEIGSLDINGSLRGLFDYCNYVGFDVGHGPGVDYAVQGQDVVYPDDSFDIAVSSECFEHNPYWKETFANMDRMVKDDRGIVAFSCAGTGRPEHGTTRTDGGSSPLTVGIGWEYYQNLAPDDFKGLTKSFDAVTWYENTVNKDLYFVGVRGVEHVDLGLGDIPWA